MQKIVGLLERKKVAQIDLRPANFVVVRDEGRDNKDSEGATTASAARVVMVDFGCAAEFPSRNVATGGVEAFLPDRVSNTQQMGAGSMYSYFSTSTLDASFDQECLVYTLSAMLHGGRRLSPPWRLVKFGKDDNVRAERTKWYQMHAEKCGHCPCVVAHNKIKMVSSSSAGAGGM